MTSLKSYDIIFFSDYRTLEISNFFISQRIWLKFVSEDKFWVLISNLRLYFTLEANIKPILAISCNFAPKKRQALLNNRVAMAIIKATDKQNLYFWMLHT